ncbi:MAG TPA: N-acetyl-gamma-glutamyl-phosphate reductase, partial [Caldimonas sp.]|nr:N-acetyl-gamma-glutamyl-phosphate reductase [Caldimonas sp.]
MQPSPFSAGNIQMGASVFIDGDQGTTGLEILERLSRRHDIDLVTLPDGRRKDAAARAMAIDDCDVAVLCLPDEASRQAVAGIRNPRVRVIDASSAYRTDAEWVYGFPEMSARQPALIARALRVSNPGCYPTGAVALLRPLVEAGCLRSDAPVSIHAVSGYSGRGREGIARHEGPGAATALSFQTYGLDLQHKHVPEIRLHSGLQGRPLFVPSYGNFRQGIALTIPLHASMLHWPMTADSLREVLARHYRDQRHVHVLDAVETAATARLDPQALNGTDDLQLAVFGNDAHEQILLSAVFDNLGKGACGAA